MAELLRMERVWAGYGDAIILEDVSFTLEAGDSLALLGRNGMGKTTLLATLMGATRLRRGRMLYRGADLARVPPHRRAAAGGTLRRGDWTAARAHGITGANEADRGRARRDRHHELRPVRGDPRPRRRESRRQRARYRRRQGHRTERRRRR